MTDDEAEAALERHRDGDRRDSMKYGVAALLERFGLKPTATNPRPMPSDHLLPRPTDPS